MAEVEIIELQNEFRVDEDIHGKTVFRAYRIRNLGAGSGVLPPAFPQRYASDREHPECLLVSRRILRKINLNTIDAGALFRSNNPFVGGIRTISAAAGSIERESVPYIVKYQQGDQEAYEIRNYEVDRPRTVAVVSAVVNGKSAIELTETINRQIGRWYTLTRRIGEGQGIQVAPQAEQNQVFYRFVDWSGRDSGTGSIRVNYRFITEAPVRAFEEGYFGASHVGSVPGLRSLGSYIVRYPTDAALPPTIEAIDPRTLYESGERLPGT